MAKKDVIQYYLQLQSQYFEMLSQLKDLQEALQTKHITEEQFEFARQDIDVMKTNYERISYIMLLLNKPKAKNKRAFNQELKYNKELYKYLKGASKEAVLDESKNALADFRKYVEEIKHNGDK